MAKRNNHAEKRHAGVGHKRNDRVRNDTEIERNPREKI